MMNARHKVLVVDDERIIVRTLSAIFESLGYETAMANSGEEEIQIARSFQPECIVSDVKMGMVNGIEAAIEVLGLLPHCKVLLMSGDAPCLSLMTNAHAKGFDFEVLQKPVPLPELLQRVSQLLSTPAEPDGDCAYRHCTLPITPNNSRPVAIDGALAECGKQSPSEANRVAMHRGAA